LFLVGLFEPLFQPILSAMSLTTALALLGVVVLAALALHAWWSARRLAPAKPALLLPKDNPRTEPGMGEEARRSKLPAGLSGDPAFVDTEPEALVDLPKRPARTEPRLDALIDALVPLLLDAPISGDMALLHMPSTRRAGSKPLYVEGLDTESGTWELICAGRRYSELQAGVQMVNRSGPLNEIEYSEFVQKIQSFADAVGARSELPDMLEVVARARELDAQSSPLDAQLSVKLRSNGVAWSVAYVEQLAARLGFVPGGVPGRLVLPAAAEASQPVLVLSMDSQAALADSPQASAVRECQLSLDVPQTAESAEAFPLFHLSATSLAGDLDATAVDNDGQPITLQSYAAIGQELNQIYRKLELLDLAAGTPAARRLFS